MLKTIFLFKAFSRNSYANAVQELIALPRKAHFKYDVNKVFYSDSFFNNDLRKVKKGTNVVLFCVFYPEKNAITEAEIIGRQGVQYIPLRYGKVVNIEAHEQSNIVVKVELSGYPDWSRSNTSTITQYMLNNYPQKLPMYYKCGSSKDQTKFDLISYHEISNEVDFYHNIGKEKYDLDTPLSIIKGMLSYSSDLNQSYISKLYNFSVIRFYKNKEKECKIKDGKLIFQKNSRMEVRISTYPIDNRLPSLSNDERKISIEVSCNNNNSKKIQDVVIDISENIRTKSVDFFAESLENYTEICFNSQAIALDKISANQTQINNENSLLVFGNFVIGVKEGLKNRILSYLKHFGLRLLQAIPIALLIFKDRFEKLIPDQTLYNVLLIIPLCIYVLIPTEKFLGSEIKSLIRKEENNKI